jgi:hypothetical protein
MTTRDPSVPAKPVGKERSKDMGEGANVVTSDARSGADEQGAAARRMRDALEDDEVRQALSSLHADRTVRPIR